MSIASFNRKRRNARAPLPLAGDSSASAEVARLFGIDPLRIRAEIPRASDEIMDELVPKPGTITFVTGPSGAGKSSLLRQMRDRLKTTHRFIDLNRIVLRDRALIECFPNFSVPEALQYLSRAGLCDASCYARKPSELSEGQRWRLKLALALQRAHSPPRRANAVLLCDEFAAMLDRVTACVVARSLRRCIDRSGNLSALLATSHDDLIRALRPDVVARCDFGKVRTYNPEVRP